MRIRTDARDICGPPAQPRTASQPPVNPTPSHPVQSRNIESSLNTNLNHAAEDNDNNHDNDDDNK